MGLTLPVTPRAHMGLLVPRLIASERISVEIAIHLISPLGPGHLDGRRSVSANGNGKQLHDNGPNAYALHKLGGEHSIMHWIS